MKPKRIILIRHGQSEGNVDQSLFEFKPDYALNLTDEGIEQAKQAGMEINAVIGQEALQVYVSPYYRTRQTFQYIQESLHNNVVKVFEDPRLREQDWGTYETQILQTASDRNAMALALFITAYQMANRVQTCMTG